MCVQGRNVYTASKIWTDKILFNMATEGLRIEALGLRLDASFHRGLDEHDVAAKVLLSADQLRASESVSSSLFKCLVDNEFVVHKNLGNID